MNFKTVLEKKECQLQPLTDSHLLPMYQWRTHPTICTKMTTQQYFSWQQHLSWAKKVIASQDQQYWMVYFKKQMEGIISVQVNPNYSLLETGFYLRPRSVLNQSVIAFLPTLIIHDFLFSLGQQQLIAHVLVHNTQAIRFNEQLGYQIYSSKEGILTLLLAINDYQHSKKRFTAILR